eukprot:4521032-Alexandrium_andersonii.AAC.1
MSDAWAEVPPGALPDLVQLGDAKDGVQTIAAEDVERNGDILEGMLSKWGTKTLPTSSIASAIGAFDQLHGDRLTGNIGRQQKRLYYKGQAGRLHVLWSYALKLARRSPTGSRFLRVAKLKLLLQDTGSKTNTSTTQGDHAQSSDQLLSILPAEYPSFEDDEVVIISSQEVDDEAFASTKGKGDPEDAVMDTEGAVMGMNSAPLAVAQAIAEARSQEPAPR